MNDNKTHAYIKNMQTKTNIKNIQPKPQNLDNVCLSHHWGPWGTTPSLPGTPGGS